MRFCDLVVCNKDWEDTTELIVVYEDSTEVVSIRVRAARFIFGDRHVLWFRDCVVMLL